MGSAESWGNLEALEEETSLLALVVKRIPSQNEEREPTSACTVNPVAATDTDTPHALNAYCDRAEFAKMTFKNRATRSFFDIMMRPPKKQRIGNKQIAVSGGARRIMSLVKEGYIVKQGEQPIRKFCSLWATCDRWCMNDDGKEDRYRKILEAWHFSSCKRVFFPWLFFFFKKKNCLP